MPADPEQVLGQMYVAFGQGAGSMRVSRRTVTAIRERYSPLMPRLVRRWDTDGVQVLERVRAIGRLAALKATEEGQTVIEEKHFLSGAPTVEAESETPLCPDGEGEPRAPAGEDE